MSITEAELIEALRAAQKGTQNDEGCTSDELAERLGVHRKKALELLQILAKAQRVTVGRRSDYRVDGVGCKKPVYRLVA